MSEFTHSRFRKHQKNKKLRRQTVQFFVVAMFLFTIVLVSIFFMMYRSAKESIIRMKENDVQSSVSDIAVYLETANNAVIFSRHNVEILHNQGASSQVISEATKMITSTFLTYIDDTLAGIYGYLYGEYVDGAGWVPDDDYEPTQRIWYQTAITSAGKLVYTAPYIDAESNNTCITIAQTLDSDPKSVIALDLKLNSLSDAVKTSTSETSVVSTRIVDMSNHAIIASSEASEILSDSAFSSLPSSLTFNLKEKDTDYVTFKENNHSYLAYRKHIYAGWYYFQIYDQAELFKSLRYIYVISSLVLITLLLFILIIFQKVMTSNEETFRRSYMDYTDPLTNTRNAESGEELTSSLLQRHVDGLFAVVGVDNFRRFQKDYDSKICEKAVVAVAEQLTNKTFAQDIVYHLKDNLFCVYFPNITTKEEAQNKFSIIFSDLSSLVISGMEQERLSVSIGAVLCEGKTSYDEIYHLAEENYHSSDRKKNISLIF